MFDPSSTRAVKEIRDIKKAIYFRIFSLGSLGYKWSIYKKHEGGQEEFVSSENIDLKPVIDELQNEEIELPPGRSSLKNIPTPPSMYSKDITISFKGTGINLKFIFYVSDQKKLIETAINELFHPKSKVEGSGRFSLPVYVLSNEEI